MKGRENLAQRFGLLSFVLVGKFGESVHERACCGHLEVVKYVFLTCRSSVLLRAVEQELSRLSAPIDRRDLDLLLGSEAVDDLILDVMRQ